MTTCCEWHNQHCEPPGDLCCERCTEAAHDTFPTRHADGSACVMTAPPAPAASRESDTTIVRRRVNAANRPAPVIPLDSRRNS